MAGLLEKFRTAKEAEVAALRQLAAGEGLPRPWTGARPPFAASLHRDDGIAVIAEYKRASPSKGEIAMHLSPEDVAGQYAEAGADALSVLTETVYFKGDMEYLERMRSCGLPLLRKDFIIDPLQVEATAASPASAMLLIVRMFDSADALGALISQAESYGLECVVEIYALDELDMARDAGATIIQVNNRDLDTLTVDLEHSARAAVRRAADETWISASGISTPGELARVRDMGYDAALVGTFLMQDGTPREALRSLLRDRGTA